MTSARRPLQAAKQVVRKDLRHKLKILPDLTKAAESKSVISKLLATDAYLRSKSLSLYLSMPTEIYTHDLLIHALETGKKCYIPHYIGDDMKMVRITDLSDYESLPLTSWNIKQPADDDIREKALDSEGLDLIIVPGLGFTTSGKRLGRGKGHYDSYFRKYEETFGRRPALIGLAYSCQMLDDLPADDYDVLLDEIVSP